MKGAPSIHQRRRSTDSATSWLKSARRGSRGTKRAWARSAEKVIEGPTVVAVTSSASMSISVTSEYRTSLLAPGDLDEIEGHSWASRDQLEARVARGHLCVVGRQRAGLMTSDQIAQVVFKLFDRHRSAVALSVAQDRLQPA